MKDAVGVLGSGIVPAKSPTGVFRDASVGTKTSIFGPTVIMEDIQDPWGAYGTFCFWCTNLQSGQVSSYRVAFKRRRVPTPTRFAHGIFPI